jgi:uncharacterized membrane protein
MKKLAKYFISGLVFVAPIGITVYVIYWMFGGIDRLVGGPLNTLLQNHGIPRIPGLGVLILLIVITLVGVLTSTFLMKGTMRVIDSMMGRLPLVKLLYSSIKDLIGAFVGNKKRFDKPVLVTLVPQGDIKAMGFITRESLEFLGLTDQVAVYFPQSYNFAGGLAIVPRNQVHPLNVDSADVMAFIVSGGISGPGQAKQVHKE